MTPEQRQEEISKAYLHAVAAASGFAVASWTQDHGGVDATVGAASRVEGGALARPKVDIQLKATARSDVEHEDHISFQLDIAHYDSLRDAASLPHLLVVLLLPQDLSAAIEHTVDHLLVRRCAYWVTMTGMPSAPESAKSRTVHLPKTQVFSPEALHGILTRISRREQP